MINSNVHLLKFRRCFKHHHTQHSKILHSIHWD